MDMVFGILKSKHIHLAKVARALKEMNTPKKTEERLSYHLEERETFGSACTRAILEPWAIV